MPYKKFECFVSTWFAMTSHQFYPQKRHEMHWWRNKETMQKATKAAENETRISKFHSFWLNLFCYCCFYFLVSIWKHMHPSKILHQRFSLKRCATIRFIAIGFTLTEALIACNVFMRKIITLVKLSYLVKYYGLQFAVFAVYFSVFINSYLIYSR